MRFTEGYIKFHRRTVAEDIGSSGSILAVWVTLLCWATRFESKIKWKGAQRSIPPGSVFTGIRELAARLNFSKDTVSRALKYLRDRDSIALEIATHGTLVTIRNWADYQIVGDMDATRAGQTPDTDRTRTGLEPEHIGEGKKERSNTPPLAGEELKRLAWEWKTTLKHFKAERELIPGEDLEIARAASRYGAENVRLALVGARFEEKTETFDPGKNLKLQRILGRQQFDKLVTLGAQNKPQERDVTPWGVPSA